MREEQGDNGEVPDNGDLGEEVLEGEEEEIVEGEEEEDVQEGEEVSIQSTIVFLQFFFFLHFLTYLCDQVDVNDY